MRSDDKHPDKLSSYRSPRRYFKNLRYTVSRFRALYRFSIDFII